MTDNQCLCITLRYEEEGAASGVSWASLSSGRPAAVSPLITQTLQEAEERSSKNKLTPNNSRRQKKTTSWRVEVAQVLFPSAFVSSDRRSNSSLAFLVT